MVAGFAQSGPNQQLMRFAAAELGRLGRGVAIDIGCGAARNTLPLAQQGWDVVGVDLSEPMLLAAADRIASERAMGRVALARATMEELPVVDGSADLIVAHGIWNLASSSRQFRRAAQEAARAAKPGAALFVFTFSRNTFSDEAQPVDGEEFVFTQFSGQPQCFLTEDQLFRAMRESGFEPDPAVPLREYNRQNAGRARFGGGPPVIYEAAFRRM
jgi:SAM-dependent methyltransferase